MVIAGDWNTDLLSGSGVSRYPYGPRGAGAQLIATTDSLGLEIPTLGVGDPGPQRLFLIDHIAVPTGNTDVTVVQASSRSGVQLSDHPIVVCSWQPSR